MSAPFPEELVEIEAKARASGLEVERQDATNAGVAPEVVGPWLSVWLPTDRFGGRLAIWSRELWLVTASSGRVEQFLSLATRLSVVVERLGLDPNPGTAITSTPALSPEATL